MKHRTLAALAVALLAATASCSSDQIAPDPAPTSAVTAEASIEPAPEASSPEVAEVPVPDVAGMSSIEAWNVLSDAGLDSTKAPDVPKDILGQTPSAGTLVPQGSLVTLSFQDPVVVPHTVERDGADIRVTVSQTLTFRDAQLIMYELAVSDLPDDGYFVSINCDQGGTDTADNRQANGKLARGNIGSARTGLNDGAYQTELVDGATCP